MPKPVRGFDSDWTLSQTAESKKTLLARCGEEKETPEKGKETPSLEKGTPSERNRLRADVHTKSKKDRTLLPATNPQGARLVGAAKPEKPVLQLTENRKEPEQQGTPREKERSSEKPDETKT